MLVHLYKTSRVSSHTIQRLLNVVHVRYTEYNRKTNDLKIEFSNGDNKSFLNVPTIDHLSQHIKPSILNSMHETSQTNSTIQRILNIEHVRYAEYNNLNRELKVEYSNGEVKCFMNVGNITDFVESSVVFNANHASEIQSLHVDPGVVSK